MKVYFFGLLLSWSWGLDFFLCIAYLVLSLRSFVSFLFACNASNFKKPTAENETLLLVTHQVSCAAHEVTTGKFLILPSVQELVVFIRRLHELQEEKNCSFGKFRLKRI